MAQRNTVIDGDDSPQSQTIPLEGKSVRWRTFLQSGLFTAAALLLKSSPAFDRFIETAQATSVNLVHDMLNGLLAFAVPGPDAYQALATRTAEKIFQRYFGGDPWVESEAPVSSIDPAVAKSVIERGL